MTGPVVCYVAHPVGALPEEIEARIIQWRRGVVADHAAGAEWARDPGASSPTIAARAIVADNLARTRRWIAALIANVPDVAWCCPWLPYLDVLEDSAENRVRGLRDDCAMAARCDGIALFGGRVSTGMGREHGAVLRAGGWSVDWSRFIEPAQVNADGWRVLRMEIETLAAARLVLAVELLEREAGR